MPIKFNKLIHKFFGARILKMYQRQYGFFALLQTDFFQFKLCNLAIRCNCDLERKQSFKMDDMTVTARFHMDLVVKIRLILTIRHLAQQLIQLHKLQIRENLLKLHGPNPANICWSSRHVLKTSSTRFQRNNFTSSKTF